MGNSVSRGASQRLFKTHYSFVCPNQSLSSVEAGDKIWEVGEEWGDYRTKSICMTFDVSLKL